MRLKGGMVNCSVGTSTLARVTGSIIIIILGTMSLSLGTFLISRRRDRIQIRVEQVCTMELAAPVTSQPNCKPLPYEGMYTL